MPRRPLSCLWLLLPLLAMLAFPRLTSAEQPRRPNIVVLLADDLGYGDLGCYGQEKIHTPHLDRMAQRGLRFTQHYAGSTVCAPSRASLLTGLHMGHAPIRGNGRHVLRPREASYTTLPLLLKQAGYHTAMIGKSSVGGSTSPGDAAANGFDHFFGYLTHWAAHDYFPPALYRNGEKIDYPNNTRHEGDTYSQDLFHEETMRYLETRADEEAQPFFLFVAFQMPHASLYAEEEDKAPYRGQFDEEPVTNQDHYRNEPEPKATYAGMVSRLDKEVGAILDKLEELGLAEETLVIFTSDNGSMNEGGYQRKWFDSSGPLRGGKRDLYEGGIRVPMIAQWPGTISAGGTSDHVSAFWDVLPTLSELVGEEIPGEIDGISFLPTLLDQGDQRKHEFLYWEYHDWNGKQAVRAGPWKAVRLNVKEQADAPIELYHLERDPGETHNVAAEHPEIVAQMKQFMQQAHTPHPAFPLTADEHATP